MNVRRARTRGFSVVEALVAASLCLTVVVGISAVFGLAVKSVNANSHRTQVAFLAEEGLEIARMFRDNGWTSNIVSKSVGSPFYTAFDGTNWTATSTNIFIDGLFERKITFDTVYRDGSQNIAASGTTDPNMRKVTVTVSWKERQATTTASIVTYLANIYSN